MNGRTLFAVLLGVAVSVGIPIVGLPRDPTDPTLPVAGPAARSGGQVPGIEAHPLTAVDLRAFLDGFVPYAIAQGDIAGAEVAVVKGGSVLMSDGYGFADAARRRRVSADRTLFRPGSIGKLFTWTAVMQQVERGRIDLDRDVNAYLDFRLPSRFGRPITMRDLMTHTGGFAETFKDAFVSSADDMQPLGVYVRTHIPPQIYAPGTVVAYSNYGATLAGYVVQRVSGLEYGDYVQKDIFAPLGMAHSTLRQPVPAALQLSDGFILGSGPAQPFEYIEIAPAGGSSSTAGDMAKFMIAHLQDGRLGSARILKPATARLMHRFERTEAPGLNGFALGFYEEDRNGQRIIGHAGDTNYFHSELHLILSADVGLYVSFNSAGTDGAAEMIRTDLFRAFLDRYYPVAEKREATVATAAADAKAVEGWYLSSRREQDAFPLVFLIGESQVAAQPDGTITFAPLKTAAGVVKKWREVGPLRYREIGGPAHLVFVRDAASGRIAYVTTDDFLPVFIFQRVPFWMQLNVIQVVGEGALAICLITLIVWPIGALVRRHYRQPLTLPRAARRLRLATRLTCLLVLLDAIGWAVVASTIDKARLPDALLYLLYALGVICVLAALATIANAAVTWRSTGRTVLARIGETFPALAAVAFAWVVLAFGFANFNVHY